MIPKQTRIESKKLRDSAKGEQCTFQIPGVCNHDPETTVLCHLPSETGGKGLKSSDIIAAFGCNACHDAIDLRTTVPYSGVSDDREWFMRRAMYRTWHRWIELGLIEIK